MSTEPNGTARPWTAADVRALRDATNRPGLVTVPVFGDAQPPVTLDLSGISLLTLTGRIPNPLLVERSAAIGTAGDALQAAPQDPQAVHATVRAILEYHDLILAAVVIAPRYYALDQLPPGAQPEDGLTVFDFDAEMRSAIMHVLNQGGDELASFRTDPCGFAARLASEGVRDAAESDADAPGTSLPPVLAGSGDLAAGADVATGDPGAGGALARGRRRQPRDAA
jgi:hypothetical protein